MKGHLWLAIAAVGILSLLVAACGQTATPVAPADTPIPAPRADTPTPAPRADTPTPVPPTDTPPPPTDTALPTEAPLPTEPPVPTDTPSPPTATSVPPTNIAAPPADASIGDTWIRPADGMVMVYVPAGEFLMGSTEEDIDAVMAECGDCEREWFAVEQPQHSVYLDAYWIDRTEVTNAQYRNCVDAGACEEQKMEYWGFPRVSAPDLPVAAVTWHDAQAYVTWLTQRTGQLYRLPTEAEWEKAARGTDARIYPWGNSLPDCDRANYWDCGNDEAFPSTLPVGSFPDGASPYGAWDMAGNVWEWVADRYDKDYYAQSPSRNPQGPESGDTQVIRGGAIDDVGRYLRCAFRFGLDPDFTTYYIGFRVVVTPGTSEP